MFTFTSLAKSLLLPPRVVRALALIEANRREMLPYRVGAEEAAGCGAGSIKGFSGFTGGYSQAKITNATRNKRKPKTLPSGPIVPPVNQRGPWRFEFSRCPFANIPLSGTE